MTAPNQARRFACVAALALLSGCSDAVAPVLDEPSQYISMRRAWLPGERAATIAAVMANASLGPMSSYAESLYALDSVTVVGLNPDFSVRAVDGSSLLLLSPQFSLSWNIAGMDILDVYNDVIPADTLHWIGAFWYNPAEPAWKGFAYGAAPSAAATTLPRVDINTTAFDAAFGKTGAGGGEIRPSMSTYWQGNGPIAGAKNDMQITVASYGTPTTVTTGPFLNGTMATGTMQGRLQKISMARISGTDGTDPSVVDYDFRGVPINSMRLTCIHPSPCTTNVPVLMASLRR